MVNSRQTELNLPLLDLKELITEYRTKQEIAKTYIGFMWLRTIFQILSVSIGGWQCEKCALISFPKAFFKGTLAVFCKGR